MDVTIFPAQLMSLSDRTDVATTPKYFVPLETSWKRNAYYSSGFSFSSSTALLLYQLNSAITNSL